MKKKILTLISLLVMVMSFTSCEAKKKVTKASYPEYTSQGNNGPRRVERVKEESDECELASLNESSNEYRSYGSAIDEDYDFARHQAVLSAKAALVDRLQTSVINVMKNYRAKTQANGKIANEGLVKQDIGSMAERVLENCRVICSNRYRMSDGTYESTVCISIPATTAENVVGAAVLNDDERLGVEFHAEQFRDSYRDDLERFRQQMKEGR
ncbi:MAG: hypothetical protein K2H60_04380 [Muribaculaceae bacterium]|nr:hypothetical protein [Muribaculaceae bacterium]